MYLNEIIGQEELKLKLKKMVNKGQFPHCQLFIDSKGYGALPLALSCGMGLIYGFIYGFVAGNVIGRYGDSGLFLIFTNN